MMNPLDEERERLRRLRLGVPEENVLDLRKAPTDQAGPESRRPQAFFARLRQQFPKARPRAYRFVGHYGLLSALGNALKRLDAFRGRQRTDRLSHRNVIRLPVVAATSAIGLAVLAGVLLVSYESSALRDVRGRVLGASTVGYQALTQAQEAAFAFDFSTAESSFTQARTAFEEAEASLEQVGSFLLDVAEFIPGRGEQVASGRHLLRAGRSLSDVGAMLAGTLDELSRRTPEASASLVGSLSLLSNRIGDIEPKLAAAERELNGVDPSAIPTAYVDRITEVRAKLPLFRESLDRFRRSADLLGALFAGSDRRFLLLFQNNREMRPTGGFLGSFAYASFDRGAVKNIEVPAGGSYDLAGQLREKVIPPKPIQLLNPLWNIQDANWFPDFPTSSQKVIDFFERTAGFTPDGVIALTPTVVEDLLRELGPIDLTASHGVTVTSDNFVRLTQEQIEAAPDLREPKKFIADVLPLLFDRLMAAQPDEVARVAATLGRRLTEKHLLFFSRDTDLEGRLVELGWGGEIRAAPKDGLMVVDANIGGGKTDGVIEELVLHEATVQTDGTIIDTVTLIRRHHGSPSDPFTKVRNVDYVRFYVPAGSELLETYGFEEIPSFRYQRPDPEAVEDPDLVAVEQDPVIHEPSGTRITREFGKTVFGNWVSVGPGESASVRIRYRLPFRLDLSGFFDRSDTYEFFLQKQPGSLDASLFSRLILPEGLAVASTPLRDRVRSGLRFVEFSSPVFTDLQYGAVVERAKR